MDAYINFAWRDASSLVWMTKERYGTDGLLDWYEDIDQDAHEEYEERASEDICRILKATESRRRSILSRIEGKDQHGMSWAILTSLYSIMALERAGSGSLRRMDPGSSYRKTCAACYMRERSDPFHRVVLRFPHLAFNTAGEYLDITSAQ